MPHGDLYLLALTDTSLSLGVEVFLDQSSVLGIILVHLAGLHVFHLGMVDKLLDFDVVTTDEEDTLDVEIRLLTNHAESSERVLLEALKSLYEPFEQVLELVANLTLVSILVVVEEPEGPAGVVDLLHHRIGVSLSIGLQVDEEGLKVVDDKRSWR